MIHMASSERREGNEGGVKVDAERFCDPRHYHFFAVTLTQDHKAGEIDLGLRKNGLADEFSCLFPFVRNANLMH